MTPILIHTDTSRFNDIIRQKSVYLPDFNEVFNDYTVLGLSALSGSEFEKLFHDTAGVIYDKMVDGNPMLFNGLGVNKHEAIKLVQKPDGYTNLIDIIESLKRSRPNWQNALSEVDVVSSVVVLKQSVIDVETAASKTFLKTEEEKKFYDFAQAVIAAGIAQFGDGRYDLSLLVAKAIGTVQTPGGSTANTYRLLHKNLLGFGLGH